MALAQDAEAVTAEMCEAGGAERGPGGRTGGAPPQSTPPEYSGSVITTGPGVGAMTTEPTKDALHQPNGGTARTTADGAATKTTADGAATKTTTDCAATKTTADCAATKTTADGAATKTTADGAATKTTADGAATKTTADGAATMTPTSGSKSNAGKKTVDTTKTTASETPGGPAKTALDKELEALLSLDPADPPPHDVLMIQSEPNGTVDILKADPTLEDPNITGKGPPPPLRPATTWTSANLREFKHRMASEKHGLLTIRRGEVVTVRVPTHPEGKRLCWEFATDDYDIGFGIYFDWTPVTSTAVTLQVSESSDDEEEETESPWHSREGDVERGSVYRLRSRYGEIMQVYRRDSHREVQAGSHEYPGEGVYLLKLDNSYSLLRNKTLYFHVYYSS